MIKRLSIAGCPVDALNREELVDKLCQAISRRERCQVLGPNAAFAVMVSKDPGYGLMLEEVTFLPADGFGFAYAARLLGHKMVTHVGIERLVYDLLPRLAEMRVTVYLLGARDFIVKKAATEIEKRYEGIRVVGTHDGYFSEFDEERILSVINQNEPDLLLVGITSPKKEVWMTKHRGNLKATVTIGVGGLFDVLAGQIPPAPYWMKDHGLEWVFRFIHDPLRLWKRYIIGNAKFFRLIFNELIIKKIQ